jgi:hypothetical protein
MKRKRRIPSQAELIARMQMAFAPTRPPPLLDRRQVMELSLIHNANLDAVARGFGSEELLWQIVGGLLTWSHVAEQLGAGIDEMREQLDLGTRLVERYGRTGRVVFSGLDYQLAKGGVTVMDQLSEIVDVPTAVAAADWSEAKVKEMAAATRAQAEAQAA